MTQNFKIFCKAKKIHGEIPGYFATSCPQRIYEPSNPNEKYPAPIFSSEITGRNARICHNDIEKNERENLGESNVILMCLQKSLSNL